MSLVIFDFDGTLVDTLTDIAAALNAARAELGAPIAPVSTVRGWIGEGLDHLIREALPDDAKTDAAHAELKSRYRGHYEKLMFATSKPYAGVVAMLDRLADSQLAVCSNKSEHFVVTMLAHFGLAERFMGVVGGDTLAVRKPDPVVIHHLVERAGDLQGPIWMVGDSAVDICTGKAARAKTIGCAYGIRGRQELEDEGAEFIVDTPAAIADIIRFSRY